jgi:DNA-binding MarR family transcriptional regulator
MNELAEYLVMDRSTLGHNLRPLLRQGLVALKPDAIDGRTRRVTLTAKGAAKYANAKASWRKAQQEYEVLIGKTAAVSLRNALQKLATSGAH